MKIKNLTRLFILMTAGLIFIFSVGCKEGPAGADGAAGAAGTDGTNGTDGKDGVVVSAADSTAYNAADGFNGGQLYDKFMSVLTISDTVVTNNKDFFRCKGCHGWDLIGTNGAYHDRDATGTRPHVAPNNLRVFAANNNIRTIFDAVKHVGGRTHKTGKVGGVSSLNDIMPDYSSILGDDDVWDIVRFLKAEALNPDDFYDLAITGLYPTGTKSFKNVGKGGVAADGDTYYAATCASGSCHDTDGTGIAIDGSLYLGDFFRSKAYEAQHKMKFGQPGTAMNPFTNVTVQDIQDLFAAGQDTTNFPGF